MGEGEREGPPIPEQLLEERARLVPPAHLPERTEVGERRDDRVVRGDARRGGSAQVPVPARLVVGEEVDVGAGVQR